MTKRLLRMWRARFEDFVRFESDLDLCDPDGNDLDFENGKPMWNPRKTVRESGDFVEVYVRMNGCVDDYDEQKAAMWLRRFAATNGVYHINVDFEVIHDNGSSYSIEASTSFDGSGKLPRPKMQEDSESFWIIGDLDRYEFYGTKGDGFDHCPMTMNDPTAADQYESFDEALNAMVEDDEVFEWVDEQPDPESVRPLIVEVKTTVKAAKK